jgi:phage terminase small subunit
MTPKQRAFVDHYITCRNASEAARRAGYSQKSAYQSGYSNMKNYEVKAALEAAEAKLARKTEITKTTVVEALRAAGDDAKQSMDGGNMIRAWCAIGKILGLDRPEAKKEKRSAESDALRAQYEALSDQELLDIVARKVAAPTA